MPSEWNVTKKIGRRIVMRARPRGCDLATRASGVGKKRYLSHARRRESGRADAADEIASLRAEVARQRSEIEALARPRRSCARRAMVRQELGRWGTDR